MTFFAALHEALYEGVISQGMSSLLKCKRSMPKSFDCFQTARVAMDATEITQDIPSALDLKNIFVTVIITVDIQLNQLLVLPQMEQLFMLCCYTQALPVTRPL